MDDNKHLTNKYKRAAEILGGEGAIVGWVEICQAQTLAITTLERLAKGELVERAELDKEKQRFWDADADKDDNARRYRVALEQIAKRMRPQPREFAEFILEGHEPEPWVKQPPPPAADKDASEREQTARRFINDFTEFDAQDEQYHEVVGALADLLTTAHKAGLEEGRAESRDTIEELEESLAQESEHLAAQNDFSDEQGEKIFRLQAQLAVTQTELKELKERFERLERAAKESREWCKHEQAWIAAATAGQTLDAALAADNDGGGT